MSMLCVVDLGHFVSLGPQAQKSQVVSMSGRGPRYCKYPATRPLSAFSIEFMAFLLEREEEKKKMSVRYKVINSRSAPGHRETRSADQET